MIERFKGYIRNHWHKLDLPFQYPEKMSYLFLKGFRKVIFLIFKDDDFEPFAVLKVSNDPKVFDRLVREYETLLYLSTEESLEKTVPRPLGMFELNGHKCILESALEGIPMVYFIKGIRDGKGLTQMRGFLGVVVETLLRLERIKSKRDVEGGKEGATQDALHKTVIEHGDFVPGNIHLSKRGVRIFDWEYSRVDGMPLNDLLTFSIYYVLFARYLSNEIGREKPVLNDFEETFLSEHDYTKIIWDSIKVYVERVGMKKSAIDEVFFNFARKYLDEEDMQRLRRKSKTFLDHLGLGRQTA